MARGTDKARDAAAGDDARGRGNRGLNAGMDRETLTRSLKALVAELEGLRRDEFSAGLGGSVLTVPRALVQILERDCRRPMT